MLQKIREEQPSISLFYGWEGLDSVYQHELEKVKKNTYVYVIGASSGENQERAIRFFTKYGKLAFEKKLHISVIFNTSAREYVTQIEKNIKRNCNYLLFWSLNYILHFF